jgi:hypothetical protein
VDERMIISFMGEVQYTRRPINVHVLFSPDKPEKLQKIALSRSKNFGEIA